MASWGLPTTRARVLLYIAHDPGARLRDIAATLGGTKRLAQAGHLIRQEDGRRNRYQVQAHLPLPDPAPANPPSEPESSALAGDAVLRRPGSRPAMDPLQFAPDPVDSRADQDQGRSQQVRREHGDLLRPRPEPGSSASRP